MQTTERRTRPYPQRSAPIRNWATLFGVPDRGPRGDPSTTSPEADADGRPGLEEVLSRSVSLAYRVIDDYVRQGQETARRMSAGSYGAAALVTDVQETIIRMTKHVSDFLELGLQLLELTASAQAGGGDAVRGVEAASAPRAESTPMPAADPTRMRIEVTSSVPTSVALDLRPEFARAPLVAQALRAVSAALPPLTDVSIEPGSDDTPLTLRIRVPDGHPAAVYTGVVVEESTGRPAGTVCLRVGPEAGEDGVA